MHAAVGGFGGGEVYNPDSWRMSRFAVFHTAGAFFPMACAIGFPFGSPCMAMAFAGSRDDLCFGGMSANGTFFMFAAVRSRSSREVNDPAARCMRRHVGFFAAGAFVPVACRVACPTGSE